MGSALPVEPEIKRKPNFTDAEKLFLVQQYELYKPILSSRLCDGVTNRHKQDIWLKITAELNARNPHVDRTTKDVKKKWENLATQARKEMIDYRQSLGTSAVITPPSAITMKVLELLDDVPATGRSGILPKRDYGYNEDQHLLEQPFQICSSSADDQDQEEPVHNGTRAAIEVDGANEMPVCDSMQSDGEPSLQVLMDLWRQRQQISDPIPDRSASASVEERPLRAESPSIVRNHQDVNRRRRRDEFDDSDSNPSPSSSRHDMKKLKRLKLLLETEKLMLEKKKLELEILLLNNQLKKEAS